MTRTLTPGRLFVFEGIDASGKDTMADHLTAHLRRKGRTVRRLNLPDREAGFGRHIDRLLQDYEHYEPEFIKRLIGQLYQCDNLDTGRRLHERLNRGEDVVLVRYILSSLVYQRDQSALMPLITDNYERFLPRPTATVFIDVTAQESCRRRAVRDAGKKPEFYEGNVDKMAALRRKYLDAVADVEHGGVVAVFDGDTRTRLRNAEEYFGKFIRIEGEDALLGPQAQFFAVHQRMTDAGVF